VPSAGRWYDLSVTAKRDFYDEQIQLLQAHDVDRLIDEHYTEDAELISFNVVVKGNGPLKEYFRGYVKMLGTLEVLSTDNFAETDDSVFFEATVKSDLGTVGVFDAWVIRDGKISHHFTGVHI
jgi:hypothetical protein